MQMPFLRRLPSRRIALRAYRKGSNAQKAGTRDAGPKVLPPCIERAVVRSAPGRDRAEARVIGSFNQNASWAEFALTDQGGRCQSAGRVGSKRTAAARR